MTTMPAKVILIVEDEKAIRDMIAFGLRRAGFEIREAQDCRAARTEIAARRPDLLLVDWMLPDMTGLEFTRQLKRDPNLKELPIIMLTARAEEADKVAGLEGGADDYVTKPFSTVRAAGPISAKDPPPRSKAALPSVSSVSPCRAENWAPKNCVARSGNWCASSRITASAEPRRSPKPSSFSARSASRR